VLLLTRVGTVADGSIRECLNELLPSRFPYRRHKVLDSLLIGESPRCAGYRLIITGHSLGAGCAAVLSCMIREKFQSLQCFAFCPPGGLVSGGIADYCQDFVTAFINNADMIPRMSIANMEQLRDEALEVLARIKVPKIQLYRALKIPIAETDVAALNEFLLHSAKDTPRSTEFYHGVQSFRERVEKRKGDIRHTPLYPPGKIVYILKTKEGESKEGRKYSFTTQWADKTDFNEILLASTLIDDHSLAPLISNLESVLESLKNPKGSPDEDNEIQENIFDASVYEKHTLVLERSSLICCSRPHGPMIFLSAALALVALILTLLSNNGCAFVARSTEWVPLGEEYDDEVLPTFVGVGVSTGLYSYRENESDGFESGLCLSYPDWFSTDYYLRSARACALFCLGFGGGGILFLLSAACVKLRKVTWQLTCFLLALALLLQGLVFLFFFLSGMCDEFYFPGDESSDAAIIYSTCEINWGARVGIAAMVFWFAAVVSTVRYPQQKF
jgi:hypothetical protein